ncbi:unnamed protein product [Timema podura]|uniref:Uncharacterized protein n=1 Tax=Timema podura TaxID=61482 RepID=A0ABN7NK55_TIMPD|nr:unnamed protein product [Timema podura]
MEGKNRGNSNMVHQDLTWRVQVESEETSAETWNHTWGWMLQEYKQMKEKLGQVCSKRPTDADITDDKVPVTREKRDDRSVKPFPETSCGEIGWLSSRREFQLEVHGPSPYTTRIPLHPPNHPYAMHYKSLVALPWHLSPRATKPFLQRHWLCLVAVKGVMIKGLLVIACVRCTKYKDTKLTLASSGESRAIVAWRTDTAIVAGVRTATARRDAISYSSRVLPLRIPKVNTVTPDCLSCLAAGRGSPPFEKPSVMRNTACWASGRAWANTD